MGWFFTHGASRADIIDECCEAQRGDDGTTQSTIRRHAVGNVLWSVVEVRRPGAEPVRYIRCDLLSKSREGWGYKPLDEGMGPFYYSCPLAFLALAPVANEKWREGVREYHARRAALRRVQPGDRLILRAGCTPAALTVVSARPLIGRTETGAQFRVTARHVERVEAVSLAIEVAS